MQLKQLESVKIIAEEGSITKAAEKLFVSQQALSEMLKGLEKELDFKIFSRSKRGVVPTEEGERFLNDLDIILPLADNWKQLSIHQQSANKVKIYVQYIFGELFVSESSIHKIRSLKDLDVEWDTMTANQIFEQIKNNKNAFGIIMPKIGGKLHQDILALQQNQQYIVDQIMSDRICLIVSCNDPLAVKEKIFITDLYGKTFLLNQRMLQLQHIKDMVRVTGSDAYILPYSASILDYLSKSANSFAYIPTSVAQKSMYVQNGELMIRYLEEDDTKITDFYLLYHKDNIFADTGIIQTIKEIFSA